MKICHEHLGNNNRIHISRVTALIENNVELPSLPEPILNERDNRIGQTITELIQNGDTIQIGFGSMPNAVMEYLKGHRDLGIYTEMLPDKVVELYESGAITNSNKKIYKGVSTATFALGSRKLYDFMNNNKEIMMLPCEVSNDLRNIARLDHLVSVNSTVEVDFLGQCNSETIGGNILFFYGRSGRLCKRSPTNKIWAWHHLFIFYSKK